MKRYASLSMMALFLMAGAAFAGGQTTTPTTDHGQHKPMDHKKQEHGQHKPAAADADFTKLVVARAQAAGLLLLTCGIYANVVRFLFPLTIEDEILDEGLDILAAAMHG